MNSAQQKATGWATPGQLWTTAQALVLIAAALAAYYPVVHNGYIWDDESYIEDNGQLVWPGGLRRIWTDLRCEPQYYPMTQTTLWVEHALWAKKPLGYHVDNLLLQMGAALMLWRVLLRLQVPGALAVALIFAVHPVQVESVAWATERKNVLSGFLCFLSLWSYLHTSWGRRIWRPEAVSEPERIAWAWYAASFILFCLALLSKSVTASLPAVVLLMLWWKQGKIRLADVWPLLPFFVAGLAMGTLTGWMEKYNVGAIGPDFDWMTPLDRLCIAGHAVWFYLYKLILPLKLTFIYPQWTINPHQRPWLLLYPLAALAALAGLWLLRRRLGRGPLVAMLFFVGTLLPALGFVNVFPMTYSYVADHFQYLAMIGPVTLAVAAIAPRVKLAPGLALTVALVTPLCLASNLQTHIYKDRVTLWRDTIRKNPYSWMAHNNLGVLLLNAGHVDDAEREFWMASGLRKDSTNWTEIGLCYGERHDLPTALYYYHLAVLAVGDSPQPMIQALKCLPLQNIGSAYCQMAERAKSDDEAHQDRLKAIEAYQQAIAIDSAYVPAYSNLAAVLLAEKRPWDAITECRTALQLNAYSDEAHDNLGNALEAVGRIPAAINEYQTALNLNPRNATAMMNLAAVRAAQGNFPEARQLLLQALQLDPANVKARASLAIVESQSARSKKQVHD